MASKSSDIGRQLRSVLDRMNAAALRRPQQLQGLNIRLVAVSKTKPVSMILEAYDCGQRHFGENYVKELEEKGHDPQILQHCKDIKWHFIGHLQKNKVNRVTNVPGLCMVETVDSEKLATALNNSWGKLSQNRPLHIMLQVNTSGEDSKNGLQPSEAAAMALFVQDKCLHLKLAGLMTIGAFERSVGDDINPDFQCLVQCRQKVAEVLGVGELELELSMGMSHDFEHAIEAGSTNIRVGSTIFGVRDYPQNQTHGSTASDSNSCSSSLTSKNKSDSGEASGSSHNSVSFVS